MVTLIYLIVYIPIILRKLFYLHQLFDMEANQARKLYKKLKRFQHIVQKDTGILPSFEPSKYLVICNIGLVNGLSEDIIFKHFSLCGQLDNIILLPGKSFCFISYTDIESSQAAYERYNCKLNIAQDNKPVYLLYSDKLPDIESPVKWDELPPGLMILKDFITEEEESLFLRLHDFNHDTGVMKNRQVKHFGYEFRYDTNNVDKNHPLDEKIPSKCNILWERLKSTKFNEFIPDQLTVNHYIPGQGIPSHIDTHSAFEDPILSLSLNSSIVMDFKKDNRHISVHLPRRSLCIMSGESRYDWAHGIVPRKYDVIFNNDGFNLLKRDVRVSFTFRKVLDDKCYCSFKSKCDSYKKALDEAIKDNNSSLLENRAASQLEKVHVHDIYENIANHFSETRHKPWPNVFEFVQSFKAGSLLFDIGCGNGKYLGLNKDIFSVGCDTSSSLLEVCKEREFEVFLGNCLNLPLKDDIADGLLSIAVIHHLANEERRYQAISEIIRVLKKDGRALIYVWAKDQNKNHEKSSYIKQDRKNRKADANVSSNQHSEQLHDADGITLPVHVNRTQFKHKDILVPWYLKTSNKVENTFLRYYHVFEEGELEEMCSKFTNVKVLQSYYDQGNWCISIQKTL